MVGGNCQQVSSLKATGGENFPFFKNDSELVEIGGCEAPCVPQVNPPVSDAKLFTMAQADTHESLFFPSSSLRYTIHGLFCPLPTLQ
jgi:hypothetical protein